MALRLARKSDLWWSRKGLLVHQAPRRKMMFIQKLGQTWNPRPVTRELLENTFDRLVASKWKTHLNDEALSEVLKIKAALLAEKPLPLERLMTIVDEDR